MNGSRLTGLTCSKAPGYWMVVTKVTEVIVKIVTEVTRIKKLI